MTTTPEAMGIEELEIDTPRGRFTARAVGPPDGPLVLLLHGFPDTPATFDGLSRRLAGAGRRAVAPFARGYQPSPPFPTPGEAESSVFDQLGRDAVAIVDGLSPGRPAAVVGHDNGGFTAYYAMSQAPERFSRAVTMTAGHPAAVFANTSRMPSQLWKSRYAILFRIPKLSDWYAERQGFHYLRELWERWAAPGWELPEEHWQRVRETMERSWPAPLEHYREMAFEGPEQPIPVPTLYLIGDQDGCVEPGAAAGQGRYFSGALEERVLPGVGHFPHLENPAVVEPLILEWVTATG